MEQKENFELRNNDKDYKVGDTLRLLEFDYGTYTGRECNRIITYVLLHAEQYGLKEEGKLKDYKFTKDEINGNKQWFTQLKAN